MKKTLLVIFAALVLLIGTVFAIRLFSGPKDNWICVNGEWIKHGNPKSDKPDAPCEQPSQTSTPTVVTSAKNQTTTPIPTVNQSKSQNIVVSKPKAGTLIGLTLIIEGKARVFENQLNFRVKDAGGKNLIEGTIYADSPDVGEFGNFKVETSFAKPTGKNGTLELFDYSAKDGSEIDKVSISINFESIDSTDFKVYFPNKYKDPSVKDCANVFTIERRIAKTPTPLKASILELLKGPNSYEQSVGYYTSINSQTKLNSVTIENGLANIDLSSGILTNFGGSCLVTSIKAQITKTAKQFSSVKSVNITVNGKQDALQP